MANQREPAGSVWLLEFLRAVLAERVEIGAER
jgi:hypothetical protein